MGTYIDDTQPTGDSQPHSPTPTPTPSEPTATPTPTAVPVPNPGAKDFSIKFGITTAGTTSAQDVTDTFNAVHTYIATNPAVDSTTLTTASSAENTVMPAGLATKIGVIELGDYIDMVSLSIAGYPTDDATLGYGKLTGATNTVVSGTWAKGKLLRLIVVGINSFSEGQSGSYTGSGNGTSTHMVFQFQNIPVTHRMNHKTNYSGGYAASELRTYLDGNFMTGLISAGVPMDTDVVWAPKRYVATGDNHADVSEGLMEDKLWLPTEWELFGVNDYACSNYETAVNQARLAYYTDRPSLVKSVGESNGAYWMASPFSENTRSYFCFVDFLGYTWGRTVTARAGCAPAFCVR